ncbi:MAG: FecR family protein, partial [Geminicoccaceae bacterium]
MRYGLTRGWRGRLALVVWVLGAVLWAHPVGAQGARPVGHVAELVGEALVFGSGQSDPRPLAVGSKLFEGELVATQAGAKARLEFVDGSVLTLGENTDLALDWFLHAPDLGTRNVVLRVSAGILRSLVQLVVPHSEFEVETTTAVASVRGTEWIAQATPG